MIRHRKKPLRRHLRDVPRAEAQAVVDETIALFHWLEWVADQLYGYATLSAPRRWVLRRLHRYGAQTVPELARAKALRRQSMQPLVDALVDEGLVELVSNARHARSRRAQLTSRGTHIVDRMDRIDARTLASVSKGIATAQLAAAAATLRQLREGFAIETRWRQLDT